MAQHWPKYHLNRLIQDALHDPAKMGELIKQPDDLFKEYGLSEQERTALKKPDAGVLIELGVHPILAMVYMIPFDHAVQAKLSVDPKFVTELEKL